MAIAVLKISAHIRIEEVNICLRTLDFLVNLKHSLQNYEKNLEEECVCHLVEENMFLKTAWMNSSCVS